MRDSCVQFRVRTPRSQPWRRTTPWVHIALLGVLLLAAPNLVRAQTAAAQAPGLADVTLDELTQMHISVSSASRKEEDLWMTPAAVFVITHEDIARSAASSIPELLRMVPGVQVAEIDASTWAVSIRGFNSALANKLLVLLDGRTVYSEVYSGTQWDQIDLPLDDIERIEVVRGPGGAIWGSNAVNGVINILTRSARSEPGPRLSTSLSSSVNKVEAHLGGNLAGRIDYRTYASFHDLKPFPLASGAPAFDGEKSLHAGGNLDWTPRLSDNLTISGDLYTGTLKAQLTSELKLLQVPNEQENESLAGGYLLTRWEHKTDSGGFILESSFSDQSRHELAANIRTRISDLDFQIHALLGSRHDLVWGADLRFTTDHISGTVLPTLFPNYFHPLGAVFAQDEIRVLPDHLLLTLGIRMEGSSLAGFQAQPTVRLLWALTPNQSLWAAISHAAVSPSLQNTSLNLTLDLGLYDDLPVTGQLLGNPDFTAETVTAYEAGYRTRLGRSFALDLAAFHNSNFHVESLSIPASSLSYLPEPHINSVLRYGNGFQARSEGLEASVAFQPSPALSLQASYAWMQSRATAIDPSAVGLVDTWNTPHTSLSASASWVFAPRWTLNGFLSHISGLPAVSGFSFGTVPIVQSSAPAYTRIDLHLSRKVGRALEFDAGVTNLLSPRHLEFGPNTSFTVPAYVPRAAFLTAAWSF